jgi:hypothetical protein
MKALLFICFSINLFHCQTKESKNLYLGQDLYLEILSNPKFKSSDRNIIIETYIVEIGNINDGKAITFKILPNGFLTRQISIVGNSIPSIRIMYENKKGDNNPIKMKREKLQNFISYEELTKYATIENLMLIINSYKHIYIVDKNNYVKKVQIEQLSSL